MPRTVGEDFCHSTVRDPMQEEPGAGTEKYATRKQEGQINRQSKVGERCEQRVACYYDSSAVKVVRLDWKFML